MGFNSGFKGLSSIVRGPSLQTAKTRNWNSDSQRKI